MASDLTCGSVPPLYREFYEVVCPNNDDDFDHDMFIRILSRSGLSQLTLSQIWDAVDTKQNSLTRIGLYKALALIALAQQGKAVNSKLLETYSDQELPTPNLGELADLQTLSHIVRRERSPTALSYTYQDICDLDTITVALVPEKKGLILKHVEYEVTSVRWHMTVLRRYSDFLALQDVLLLRCPYRAIPRLPPKKVIGGEDRSFIEQRRRSLQRFLTIVARHPAIANEHVLKYFFTFKGHELHSKMKEQFRSVPDEFMTSSVAQKAKELVGPEATAEFAKSREHVRLLIDVLTRVRDIAERLAVSSSSYAADVEQLGKELSCIVTDLTAVSSWAAGTSDSWSQMKQCYRSVIPQFGNIVDVAGKQAAKLTADFLETVSTLLDLLLAYKDLCDRHEKGVLSDHQKTLQKLNHYRKRTSHSTPTTPDAIERLESHILEQESQIANVENRGSFALHCIQMETQLVYTSLDALTDALDKMADNERIAHCELGGAWAQVCPLLSAVLPRPAANGRTANDATPTFQTRSASTGHLATNNNVSPAVKQ